MSAIKLTPYFDKTLLHAEAPCDNCRNADRCRALRLSCSAFGAYLKGYSWRSYQRKPTGRRFIEHFEDGAA